MNKILLRMCRFLPVLLLCTTLGAFAQKTVSGKVTSAEDKTGMPGVSIVEKGTTKGTVTDTNGSYTLIVGDNAILSFSFVGFKTQEIIAGAQTTIDVVMDPDITSLSEVVVV